MSSLRGESEKPLLDGGKPVALIAYLASAPSRQARRDQLVDLLWSDLEPDAAKHALRQTLWYIKKRVGDAILLAAGDTLSVSDRLQVDRDVLLRAAEQNDHEGVLAAYTGDFLPDFAAPGGAEFEGWADVERRRLRSLFHRSSEASVRELLGRGRSRDAVARARRARDLDPTHQSSWRLLLEALIAAQDWAQAQGEGEALERMVADEEVELEPASRSLLRVARQGGTEPTEQEEGRRGIVAELVGREREFALLLDAASQAQRGRGEHVHLRAPAGIGKSRLLGDLMARLRSARARVVLVRCDVGSRELPYAAASELALMLGRLPGARGVSPDSAAALVAMAPALSTFFTVPHDPSTDQEALRRRSQALLELATAVSEEQALVVLIDDVHWMDARSRTVLGQLATRVHALHLLIVTTGRPVVEGRLDDPEARVVELPVLTELQCAELVASIATLGQAEWGGRFTQELWRSTGGSPLHVLETLQLLRERTLLSADDGEWRSPDPGALFALLREGGALARRLDSLPRDQRWLLLLLAVAGSPLGEVRLAAAGGRDVTAESALHELEARGLVARTADGWMIAHDEMTTTVLEHASAESVRAAHAALGRALWQEGTDDLATMRRAGQHLVRGGERSALHALFGGFVRRLRALGDTRAIPALADDLLGAHARGDVVRGMVEALPWHVRAGLTSGRRVAAVAAVLLLAASIPTAALLVRSAPPPAPPSPVAELLVVSTDGATSRSWRVPLRAGEWVPGRDIVLPDSQGRVVVGDPRVSRPAIPLPGTSDAWVYSRTMRDSGGIELVVERAGSVRRLTHSRGDDLIGDVSPDGRFAVIATARWNTDSHYDLALVDLRTGAYRQVTQGDDTDQHAHWSQSGDRLAFLRNSWAEETSYLCLVNPDGSDLRCPTEWKALGPPVGWIDDDRLLVQRKVGSMNEIVVADVRDQRLTSLGEQVNVASLSPDGRWLACRCERIGYRSGSWFVMPVGRSNEARPIAVPANVVLTNVTFGDVGRPPASSEMTVDVGPSMPVVGVPHRLTAHANLASRRTEPLERVRWRSHDPDVLTIDSLTGEAQPLRPGKTRVTVVAPGWAQAEREIEVRTDVPALIGEESWEGDWLERWYDFGKPRPVTVVRDGALALNVNGDESFQSGAIRRQELSDARGITVETQLSVRISRAQWQSIRVMLRDASDLQRVTDADREDGLIGALGVPRQECAVAVPAGEGRTMSSRLAAYMGDDNVYLPLPPGVREGRWLPVRLTIRPDGRCAVALDGRQVFVSRARVETGGRVQLQVHGNAVGTESMVGRVRIWQGVAMGQEVMGVPSAKPGPRAEVTAPGRQGGTPAQGK